MLVVQVTVAEVWVVLEATDEMVGAEVPEAGSSPTITPVRDEPEAFKVAVGVPELPLTGKVTSAIPELM